MTYHVINLEKKKESIQFLFLFLDTRINSIYTLLCHVKLFIYLL